MKIILHHKRVLVAMSGGVDSSVAAALLKQQGYDVIGITMEIWPSKTDDFGGCCSASAVIDAKNVANKLGIPHYVLNFKKQFEKTVIDDFISEYKNGRTPNPCIRCNQFLKFDHLLKKADALGAKYISTGHYASIIKNSNKYQLARSKDNSKDQSYVLYVMGQKALSRTLFPLEKITKVQTRKIAKELGLAVADKKDSQEICFVEDNNYSRFISERAPGTAISGPIKDVNGKTIAKHKGIAFYTIGQRKGLGIQIPQAFYVLKIDKEDNSITVGDYRDLLSNGLSADNVVWTSIDTPEKPFKAKAKIRYSSSAEEAKIIPVGKDKIKVLFKNQVRAITPGQSVVLYKDNIVLGGGIII